MSRAHSSIGVFLAALALLPSGAGAAPNTMASMIIPLAAMNTSSISYERCNPEFYECTDFRDIPFNYSAPGVNGTFSSWGAAQAAWKDATKALYSYCDMILVSDTGFQLSHIVGDDWASSFIRSTKWRAFRMTSTGCNLEVPEHSGGGNMNRLQNEPYCEAGWISDFSYSGPLATRPPGLHWAFCKKARPPICEVTDGPAIKLGNPVEIHGGAKWHDEPIVQSPMWNVKIHYNSQAADLATRKDLAGTWRTEFESELAIRPRGAETYINISRADGTDAPFLFANSELVAQPSIKGDKRTLTREQISGQWQYRFRDVDNRIETFNDQGRLLSIVHTDGRRFDIAYQDDRVQTVTDQSGRVFAFSRDGNGVISAYQPPDGRTVTVSLSTNRNLSSLTFVDASQRVFDYASTNARRGITSIRDETATVRATYVYDGFGRVTSQQHAGGVNAHSFSYSRNSSTGATNSANITTPLSAVQSVSFSAIAGAQRTTSATLGCSGCGAVPNSYQYDSSTGHLRTQTDFRGTVTWFQRNARNLESIRIEASGKYDSVAKRSDERKIDTAWATDWRVPAETKVFRCNPQTGPTTFAACVANPSNPSAAELASARWVLEQRTTQAVNARGQVTASCIHDVADPSAMSYVCGSSANAPVGVRQTVTSYCEAADVSAAAVAAQGASGLCPVLGMRKSVDGPRTDVNDITTYSYYGPNDEAAACSAQGGAPACPYRRGDRKQVVNALGQITEMLSYDGAGRILRQKDANGVITDLSYHPRGWLASRTVRALASGAPDPADATTSIVYDARGLVQQMIQADGVFSRFVYDAAHRLIRVCDNSSNADCTTGNRLVYTLDAAGNRIKEESFNNASELRRALHRQFNNLGRLTRERDAANLALASHVYDANGNRTQTRDGIQQPTPNTNPNTNDDVSWNGRDTDMIYDPLNRLLETLDAQDLNSNANGRGKTRYEYDARDNLRKVTDAQGVPTEYVYNALGDQTQLISRDTGTSTFTYDSAGNKASVTDARNVLSTHTYDALNRMLSIVYPSEPAKNVSFSYDITPASLCAANESFHVGRLSGFTDSSGSTQFCYDRRGNTTRKIQTTRGVTLTTTMSYNLANRLIGMTYPDGLSLSHSRNALGQITSISASGAGLSGTQSVISGATYDADGALLSFQFGHGQSMQRNIDANGRTSGIDSSVLKLFFSFDRVGNITAANAQSAGAAPEQNYVYDALYRLTHVRDANNALIEAFAYDKIGNRTSQQQGSQTKSYSYGYQAPGGNEGHWLESVAGQARSYDAMGNTLTGFEAIAGLSASYDARARLSGTTAPTVGPVEMDYSGVGERTYKNGPNGATRFVYGDNASLLHESTTSGSGSQSTSYIWLENLPVAMVRAGTLYFLHADHLGSPRKATDTAGTQVWHWNFLGTGSGSNAFGQQPPTGSLSLNLRFPGQYFDVESGLHYNYFRDYEPNTGRYVESDPIGLEGGGSTFGYAGQTPHLLIDPMGQEYSSPGVYLGTAAAACIFGSLGANPIGCGAGAGVAVGTLFVTDTVTTVLEWCFPSDKDGDGHSDDVDPFPNFATDPSNDRNNNGVPDRIDDDLTPASPKEPAPQRPIQEPNVCDINPLYPGCRN